MATGDIDVCGIIMPISGSDATYTEPHWQRVKLVLEAAITDAGMKPQPVWENQANDVIQARILKNLYENDLVICDVSSRNPNVMLELGMRLSTKKPTILVADEDTVLPFDTSVIAHSFYQRDLEYNATSRFVDNLTRTIVDLREDVAAKKYVSFVENFRFETVTPATVSVSLEQHYAEKFDDMEGSLRRIEHILERDKIDWATGHRLPELGYRRAILTDSIAEPDQRRSIWGDELIETPPQKHRPTSVYRVGETVFHPKFGRGVITEVDGNKLKGDFENGGLKRVMDSFVKPVE